MANMYATGIPSGGAAQPVAVASAAAAAVGAAAHSTAVTAGVASTPGSGKKRGLSDRWRGKGSRGKYRKISSAQRQALEVEFKTAQKPDSPAREVIAARIRTASNPMTKDHVGTWFMNRRTKQRKMESGELKPKSKKARIQATAVSAPVPMAAPAKSAMI